MFQMGVGFCIGSLFYGVVLGAPSNADEERFSCFTLIVLWPSVFCVSSSRLYRLVCGL